MVFTKGQAVRMDLSKMPRWSPLFSIPELSGMFKDGRIFGKLAEHILAMEFENLNLAAPDGPFDLMSTANEAIEVKSITKGGFDTSPSAMLGAGRTYDPVGHLERIMFIAEHDGYYILADNRELPIVTFYSVPATDKLIFTNTRGNKTGKRTSNQANVFLSTLSCPVVENESQLTIVKN